MLREGEALYHTAPRCDTHTHTMNTSQQGATHTLWMARRCEQRAQARVVQGGRRRRTKLAQTTKGMKSGWQHGMAHPFCCAADDPLESTNPSVTCKSARVPTHNEDACELGPTDPSLAHRCERNDGQVSTQVAGKKAEVALEEHALAQWRPRMRSALYYGS